MSLDDLGAWLIKGNADRVGRVTAAPVADPDDGWSVSLDLTVLDEPDRVPRRRLRADPRLAGLEVLRQPQVANPSYLTVAQFAALRDHLPAG